MLALPAPLRSDSTRLVAVVALALLALGWSFGYGNLVVLGGIALMTYGFLVVFDVFGTDSDGSEEPEEPTELDALRERYARGEVGDAEFERRLDELIRRGSDPDRDEAVRERELE